MTPGETIMPLTTISLANAHGTFTTTTSGLDLMIRRHLPASPDQLRRVLAASTGLPGSRYADVRYVSEFLVMLADAEYPAGQAPLRDMEPVTVPGGHPRDRLNEQLARQRADLARTIADQAQAIADGTLTGPQYGMVRLIQRNAEMLAAWTPDDRSGSSRMLTGSTGCASGCLNREGRDRP
jgi:hypothetical protein